MRLAKGNVIIGIETSFWPKLAGLVMPCKDTSGQQVPESRVLAQWMSRYARGGVDCRQERRTLEGLQRISEANLKHGRQTKDKLEAQRHTVKVGRQVIGELKLLERQLLEAGLLD